MSINVEVNKNSLKLLQNNKIDLHYLPTTIDGKGPANVNKYFNQYTEKENEFLINSFRGYPLIGCKLNIPKDYKCVVLQETRKPLNENAERIFKISGGTDTFNYWNYDKYPSENDSLRQALDIIDLSEALAENITMEEIEEEMNEKKKEQQA